MNIGYGPKVTPDTAEAFSAYPEFRTEALDAVTPSGYASTFRNLNASVSANTYLGLYTLKAYDTNQCADFCNSKDLCTGFNLFVERNPSLNPSDNCTLPSSITNYKCTLWGSGVDAASATNYGQYRGEFQVVIAGSDGFEKTNTYTPPKQPGWQAPVKCGDGSKIHDHSSSLIGSAFFPGPYDVHSCMNYANSQNQKNTQKANSASNPFKTSFFNSYMIKKNGKPLGTYCSLFSSVWKSTDATYSPGYQGKDLWGVESSYGWAIESS